MTELHQPNSPNFNERHWEASRMALSFANAPKTSKVRLARSVTVAEVPGARINAQAVRLQSIRNPVTDAAIEAAKVVNVETPEAVNERHRAQLLGFTVKTLRAQCKAEGLRRYSSAPKATLVDMLLGTQSG